MGHIFHSILTWSLVALIEEISPSAAFRLSSKLMCSQLSRYPDSNSICWEDSVSTDRSAIALDRVLWRLSKSSLFLVGVCKQGSVGPGQGIQQFFNLGFNLCKLHLIGCELRVGFFLAAPQ